MQEKRSGITIVGNKDGNLSTRLKAYIKQGNVMVCGAIGEGASKELVANWVSPFEDETPGSKLGMVGGVSQAATDKTLRTKFTSLQIWEGNRPHTFNLPLKFYALTDAKSEVVEPIKELEKMISPDVHMHMPSGRIPQPVSINIGRIVIHQNCIIANMSVPLDRGVTKEGYPLMSEVTLQIETKTMLSRSDIELTYG